MFPSIFVSKKKEREQIGANWKRRIKGMLFFDWHFPISNNKLKLQVKGGCSKWLIRQHVSTRMRSRGSTEEFQQASKKSRRLVREGAL